MSNKCSSWAVTRQCHQLEYQTTCQLDMFRPFECRTCPASRWSLYIFVLTCKLCWAPSLPDPMAFASYCTYVPDGSMWNSWDPWSGSNPANRRATPKGLKRQGCALFSGFLILCNTWICLQFPDIAFWLTVWHLGWDSPSFSVSAFSFSEFLIGKEPVKD